MPIWLRRFTDAEVTVTLAQTMGRGGDAPIQVLIKGPDQDRLEELAARATASAAAPLAQPKPNLESF